MGITRFGTIAASGVQILTRTSLQHGDNALIVALLLNPAFNHLGRTSEPVPTEAAPQPVH
ncbi:hypothetical protein ACFTUC_03915 [Streptomyces sp. NPDC056944]|uniref:hypothetical protein n=1 Tax=Streptomyces sp. NPDC056944 TaxID=3345972 RepID=UPI003640D38D